MRIFLFCFVIVVTLSSLVAAEPLAEGYQLTKAANSQVWVSKGKRRAPIEVRSGMFELSEIKVDKRARTVAIPVLTTCNGDQVTTYTFDQLEARLVNAEALALHKKKSWKNAAKGFAAAVKLDPTWQLPAYNLASARQQLNDLPGAAAALAPWLASAPIPTYLHVTQDPELSPLLATKELAAIRAARPGNLKVTADGGIYGYNAERKLVAAQIEESNGMSCTTYTSIVLIDAQRAVQLASLPLSTYEHCGDKPGKPKLVTPKAAEQIEKLLVDFGIVSTAFESGSYEDRGQDKRAVRLPKSKLGVVTNGGAVNIVSGNTSLATTGLSEANLTWATFLPEPRLMLLGSYSPSDSCPDNGLDVIAVPAQP